MSIIFKLFSREKHRAQLWRDVRNCGPRLPPLTAADRAAAMRWAVNYIYRTTGRLP